MVASCQLSEYVSYWGLAGVAAADVHAALIGLNHH